LAAEALTSSLRVEPTPAGATIALDGVSLGGGLWEGRLRAGSHRIEVTAEGFVPQVRDMNLGATKRELVTIALERDPTSSVWRDSRGRFFLEIDGSFAAMPYLGGDITAGCAKGCSALPGIGGVGLGRGGYRFASGFTLGVDAGYMYLVQKVTGRAANVTPLGRTDPGTANDAIVLRGVLLGASAGIRLGSRFPFTIRLGTGALLGSVRDHRTGTFKTQAIPGRTVESYDVDVVAAPGLTAIYLAPELRLGIPIGKHFELSIGAEARMLFVPSPPTWSNDGNYFNAGAPPNSDGYGAFPADALTGKTIVIVAAGLGGRYEF
jgi:hypothetical protein